MNRILLNALGAVALLVLCVVGWAAFEFAMLAAENRAEIKTGLHSVFAESRDITIAMLDKGRPGKPETMGLIPATREVMLETGKTLQATQTQVQQTGTLVTAAAQSVQSMTTHVNTLADAGTQTLNSARTGVDALTVDLRDLQPTLSASTGLLDAGTDAVKTFNGRLSDPRVDALLDSFQSMAGNADGIVSDGRKVADKMTADYLKPVKWYMVPVKRFGEVWDIGAAVARHTP